MLLVGLIGGLAVLKKGTRKKSTALVVLGVVIVVFAVLVGCYIFLMVHRGKTGG